MTNWKLLFISNLDAHLYHVFYVKNLLDFKDFDALK